MWDKEIALHILSQIDQSLTVISERAQTIKTANDFLYSNEGITLLDSICMKLIAIGESTKSLDKITNKTLLASYPEIPWKHVMGVRDIIVHHYFDVDAEEIFHITTQDIPVLQRTIRQMISDISTVNI